MEMPVGGFETLIPMTKEQLLKATNVFHGSPYDLNIVLSGALPLKQAPLLWESVSEEATAWWWSNPEMLVHKEKALRFVDPLIANLIKLRNFTVDEMKEIQAIIERLEREIDKGLPAVAPPGYEAWRLNGPRLYYNAEQFDKVSPTWEERSSSTQRRAKEVGVRHAVDDLDVMDQDLDTWTPQRAWNAEREAYKAFKRLNRDYLVVKLEAFRMFGNAITSGADQLLLTYLRGRSNLGSSHMEDYAERFMDKEIRLVEKEVIEDTTMDEVMLAYGDDGDDYAPSEGVDIPTIMVDGTTGATISDTSPPQSPPHP